MIKTKRKTISGKNYKTSLISLAFKSVRKEKSLGVVVLKTYIKLKKKISQNPYLLELQMNRSDYVTNIKHYKANKKKKKTH